MVETAPLSGGGGWGGSESDKKQRAPRQVARWQRVSLSSGIRQSGSVSPCLALMPSPFSLMRGASREARFMLSDYPV